jgi:long-chain acyl-CoA synthetase
MDWRQAETEFESEVLGETTLPRMFEASADRNAESPAQRYKGGIYDRSLAGPVLAAAPDGEYASLSYNEMRRSVRRLAAGFRDLGVGAGDRVGIFADTRMEWAQADFGLLAAGGVVTTVYTGSSPDQVEYLLSDPDATGVVVENGELLERVLDVEDALDLEFAVSIDEIDGYGDREDVFTLAQVHERGVGAFDAEEYEGWVNDRAPDDLASLIYTSGTTGQPKGVRLSHRNFKANVDQVYRRVGPHSEKTVPAINTDSEAISFLPLAHVFERLSGHFLMFAAGATVGYAESPDTLQEDFSLLQPTTGASVPRVYEKLYDAIRDQAAESPVRERIFEWAVDVGRTYQTADSPGVRLRAKRAVADRLVFGEVRAALGGNVEFLVSGGGSLSPDLAELFHGMGVPILEGYGLTETAPVVSVNPPEAPEIGTIGPPVHDEEVRLDSAVVADDLDPKSGGEVGELLVRGPNVTDGYWNRPDETADAFQAVPASSAERSSADHSSGRSRPKGEAFRDDERRPSRLSNHPREDETSGESEERSASGKWFRTGDIVEQRPDGYIAFRERSKQLLVLSTGKNVAPGPIEDSFAQHAAVEQCMAIGDGEKFVGALIVPNEARVREWAADEGIDLPDDSRALCEDSRVQEYVQETVAAVNEDFEEYERIKKFALVPEEFTEDNDLLTPTMKKKRRNVLDRYADEIDDIYGR